MSINRRDETNGRIDPRVSVLRATAAGTGEVVGLVVGFACHPGDPRLLEPPDLAPTGSPPCAPRSRPSTRGERGVFLNGAAGNINPARFPYETRQNIYIPQTAENYPVYWGGFGDASRLGRTVAGAAVEAAERALPLELGRPAGRLGPVAPPAEAAAGDDRVPRLHELHPRGLPAGHRLPAGELESEVQAARARRRPHRRHSPARSSSRSASSCAGRRAARPLLLAGYANDDVRYVMTDDAYDGDQYETAGTPLDVGSARALADGCAGDPVFHLERLTRRYAWLPTGTRTRSSSSPAAAAASGRETALRFAREGAACVTIVDHFQDRLDTGRRASSRLSGRPRGRSRPSSPTWPSASGPCARPTRSAGRLDVVHLERRRLDRGALPRDEARVLG